MEQLWNKYGFMSKNRFIDFVLGVTDKFSKEEISKYIDHQGEHDLYKARSNQKKYFSHFPEFKENKDRYQLDVLYLAGKHYNSLALVCIVIRSRYLCMRPIKNTSAAETYKAYQSICQEVGTPVSVQVDSGSEFVNKLWKEKLPPTVLIVNDPYEKNQNAYVERVNKTISKPFYERMKRIENVTGGPSTQWIEFLADQVYSYNRTTHSTIKQKPYDVQFNGKTPAKQEWKKVPEGKLKTGDFVRVFIGDKDYNRHVSPIWSEEIYVIKYSYKNGPYNPTRYQIARSYSSTIEPLTKYEWELLKVESLQMKPNLEGLNVKKPAKPRKTIQENTRSKRKERRPEKKNRSGLVRE